MGLAVHVVDGRGHVVRHLQSMLPHGKSQSNRRTHRLLTTAASPAARWPVDEWPPFVLESRAGLPRAADTASSRPRSGPRCPRRLARGHAASATPVWLRGALPRMDSPSDSVRRALAAPPCRAGLVLCSVRVGWAGRRGVTSRGGCRSSRRRPLPAGSARRAARTGTRRRSAPLRPHCSPAGPPPGRDGPRALVPRRLWAGASRWPSAAGRSRGKASGSR